MIRLVCCFIVRVCVGFGVLLNLGRFRVIICFLSCCMMLR